MSCSRGRPQRRAAGSRGAVDVSRAGARRASGHIDRPNQGGALVQVGGHQVADAGLSAHPLRRSLQGQSWAEKSLENGRFLIGFQELEKPQDAKGAYFPTISPSALLEWGSGGRWFESSRPDTRGDIHLKR